MVFSQGLFSADKVDCLVEVWTIRLCDRDFSLHLLQSDLWQEVSVGGGLLQYLLSLEGGSGTKTFSYREPYKTQVQHTTWKIKQKIKGNVVLKEIKVWLALCWQSRGVRAWRPPPPAHRPAEDRLPSEGLSWSMKWWCWPSSHRWRHQQPQRLNSSSAEATEELQCFILGRLMCDSSTPTKGFQSAPVNTLTR